MASKALREMKQAAMEAQQREQQERAGKWSEAVTPARAASASKRSKRQAAAAASDEPGEEFDIHQAIAELQKAGSDSAYREKIGRASSTRKRRPSKHSPVKPVVSPPSESDSQSVSTDTSGTEEVGTAAAAESPRRQLQARQEEGDSFAVSFARRALTGMLVGMLLLMVVVLTLMLTDTGPLFILAGADQSANYVPFWSLVCLGLGMAAALSGSLDTFSGNVFAAM
jgi:hypothetical protein